MTTRVREEPSVGDPERVAAYSIRDVAERANVPERFVRYLIAVGALPSEPARSRTAS